MRTKGKVISFVICICMLMQIFTAVAFASDSDYIITLQDSTARVGNRVIYNNVQENVIDDVKPALIYNSDYYDFDTEGRETRAVKFENRTTGEETKVLLENSPLKCVYEGSYNIEFDVPKNLKTGEYRVTVMTYPPLGKQAWEIVKPMEFVVEILKVRAASVGGGGGGSTLPDTSIYTYTIKNDEVIITECDRSASGDIEIPAYIEGYPVTTIGAWAFVSCKNITSIKIPDTVTIIKDTAFYGCAGLTNIEIPDSVTTIESNVFAFCTSLPQIKLPDGLKYINNATFVKCENMTSIIIPASLQAVNDRAFQGCSALEDVYFCGTEEQWKKIFVGVENDAFTNATIHFDYKPEPTPDPEPDEPTDGDLVFNIQDTTDLTPISGAQVIIVSEDGETGEKAVSDEKGNVSVALPNGAYTVQVIASGYDVRTFSIEKTDENNEFSVYLNKNPLVKVETTAKLMTKQEMIDAGIDIEAEDNKHIYKCVTVLKFVPVMGEGSIDFKPIEINFDYIYDENGTIIDAKPIRQDGMIIYPVAKDIYLIVHSETTWIKEMFDVQLVVANTSAVEKIKDCEINLELPEGLSLATMVDEAQTLTVNVAEIKPLETKDIHWYVRGDKAGEYVIGGNIVGIREGGGIKEDLMASFTMQDPITVLAGDAMKLLIEAERYATKGLPYKMRYTLQNVSSRTLYDVKLDVLGGKFREEYSVEELIHNGQLVDLSGLVGTFNDGLELKDEEFEPGEVLTGVFEITFGFNIVTQHIEYMVSEMYNFTGEGSTTTIPTEIVLVDSVSDHVYGDGVTTKKATCTEEGEMVYPCKTCDDKMVVTIPKNDHTFGNWKITKEPTCTAVGGKYRKCTGCDHTETHEIAMVAHKNEVEITKEPTTTEEGVITYTCTVCGTIKAVAIPVCICGDVSGDNTIDVRDVISIRQFIAGGYGIQAYIAAADVNKDGLVDVRDILLIRRYVAGGYGIEFGN